MVLLASLTFGCGAGTHDAGDPDDPIDGLARGDDPGDLDPAERPNFRYSVVAGGVFSPAEILEAARADGVVREHYGHIALDRVRAVEVTQPRRVHVSYRVGDRIYWTKNKVTLQPGETVLTDGASEVRARCGNCISEHPMSPTLDEEPDIVEFDRLVAGPDDPGFGDPVAAMPLPSGAPGRLLGAPRAGAPSSLGGAPSSAGAAGPGTGPGPAAVGDLPGRRSLSALTPPGTPFAGGPSVGASSEGTPSAGGPSEDAPPAQLPTLPSPRPSPPAPLPNGPMPIPPISIPGIDVPGLGPPAGPGNDPPGMPGLDIPGLPSTPPVNPDPPPSPDPDQQPVSIPEPATWLLMGGGLAGLLLRRWRRRAD